jgi:hypothetical protein
MRASLFLFGLLLLNSAPPGLRIYENARIVAIDARARTITVRGGAVGRESTFSADPEALRRSAMLKAGDQVVLTLRTTEVTGTEVVTHIERSLGTTTLRGRGRLTPPRADALPTPVPPAPTDSSSPAPTPPPSPVPSRPTFDTVGPLTDPRVAPLADPRLFPLRDPRVIPGLTEPAPTPSVTPSPASPVG